MMHDETDRIKATYRDNYDRLLEVEQKYDPTNFFRVNHCPTRLTSANVMARTLIKFSVATLAMVLSYLAAFITTIVESGGFWQYFWFGTSLASSSSACWLTIAACRQLR
jgi:Berberine and berberine like